MDAVHEPEELKEHGSVTWGVYKQYISLTTNVFVGILYVLLSVGSHVGVIMTDWWLSYWLVRTHGRNQITVIQ